MLPFGIVAIASVTKATPITVSELVPMPVADGIVKDPVYPILEKVTLPVAFVPALMGTPKVLACLCNHVPLAV